ncbi:hypothetical protein DYB32_005505 [Aphanomyces invadans]|uniref:Prenylcysteine lyase domain-containing protein n=1 Tax=Aphanomyces invadans TaxID=157072 RepID=A0A418AUF7_9STRA|nr:hypothetical protein DYB32_005505 [Aphanomyces invadans]
MGARLVASFGLAVAAVAHAALEPQRVCIVGGGVGGSATASFLRDLVPDPSAVEIVVFEQHDVVGGRIATFDYHGTTIEAGGTVFLTGNEYIMQFTKALNLTLRIPGDTLASPPQMAIFNGREIVFQTSPISWWNMAKLVWRYGPSSLRAFQSVTKLVEAGVSPQLINELLAGITRVNYGQNTTMTALAGAVGLAGSGDDLRSVRGGNPLMIQGLLKRAQAVVRTKTKVHSIQTTPSLQVDTSNGLVSCQAVVVATPLELTDMALPPSIETPHRPFQTTHATFVQGELNGSKFEVAGPVAAGVVLTTESSNLPFSSMGLQHQRVDAANETVSLFKVFSRSRWSEDHVKEWFDDGASVVKRFPWRAYPTYITPEPIPKFKLADGVYYVNAIESAASAMEMSAVGARNVALLIANQLKKTPSVYEATDDAKAAMDEL